MRMGMGANYIRAIASLRPRMAFRYEWFYPVSHTETRQQRQASGSHLGQARPIGVWVVRQFGTDVAGVVAIEEVDRLDVELPPIVGPAWTERHAHVDAREEGQTRSIEVRRVAKVGGPDEESLRIVEWHEARSAACGRERLLG
jgi:hypothetical protein